MYIDIPEKADIYDAATDLETALAVARMCYMLYFEDKGKGAELLFASSREDIREALGAVIDYIRSAKGILDSKST